jgi:hypothetical protein
MSFGRGGEGRFGADDASLAGGRLGADDKANS